MNNNNSLQLHEVHEIATKHGFVVDTYAKSNRKDVVYRKGDVSMTFHQSIFRNPTDKELTSRLSLYEHYSARHAYTLVEAIALIERASTSNHHLSYDKNA